MNYEIKVNKNKKIVIDNFGHIYTIKEFLQALEMYKKFFKL